MQGQVYKIHSDFYYVKSLNDIYTCKLKETLKKQKENVVVGDFVELSEDNNFILNTIKRKNLILRPKVANIDLALIVSAFKEPELDFIQLNRYITFLNYYKIPYVLCFNKEDLEIDLANLQDKIDRIYRNICPNIFYISAKEKLGIGALSDFLKGKTVALCGQSGVGKSTLLNSLNSAVNLKTSSVSAKTQRGRHTTRHVEIIDCADFKIIDTPGFSNLKFDFMLPDELINYFPDLLKYSGNCKYSDCLHDVGDKGICSVVDNLDKINDIRYKSYLSFLEECRDYKEKISKKSIKEESSKKQTGSKTFTKISKQKRISSRNTQKQRIKYYEDHD